MKLPTEPLVHGVIIGTRKAGTTWLYENFRRDPGVCVSETVKESGYFAGRGPSKASGYEALFAPQPGETAVEVDTSVCFEPSAQQRLDSYNSKMRAVLIFRDPVEYLESRHRHGLRKGEFIEKDPVAALIAHEWLRRELDYPAIAARFSRAAAEGRLTILDYAKLGRDPVGFYAATKRGLGLPQGDYLPFIERVNVAREARFPFVTQALSQGAILARRLGAHALVNALKGTGIMARFERPANPETSPDRALLEGAIDKHCPETRSFYESLGRQ